VTLAEVGTAFPSMMENSQPSIVDAKDSRSFSVTGEYGVFFRYVFPGGGASVWISEARISYKTAKSRDCIGTSPKHDRSKPPAVPRLHFGLACL
jgi:hypothetical protein